MLSIIHITCLPEVPLLQLPPASCRRLPPHKWRLIQSCDYYNTPSEPFFPKIILKQLLNLTSPFSNQTNNVDFEELTLVIDIRMDFPPQIQKKYPFFGLRKLLEKYLWHALLHQLLGPIRLRLCAGGGVPRTEYLLFHLKVPPDHRSVVP